MPQNIMRALCAVIRPDHSKFASYGPESLFMFQECTNGLYLYVKFEALTTYKDGDINQNRVKISVFTLGKESCNEWK